MMNGSPVRGILLVSSMGLALTGARYRQPGPGPGSSPGHWRNTGLRRGECPVMTDETVKGSETEDWQSVDR